MDSIKAGIIVTEKNFREILNEMASIMPSEYDTSNYCYLPYWFQVTNENIIAWHVNGVPEKLKKQIQKNRDVLNDKNSY